LLFTSLTASVQNNEKTSVLGIANDTEGVFAAGGYDGLDCMWVGTHNTDTHRGLDWI